MRRSRGNVLAAKRDDFDAAEARRLTNALHKAADDVDNSNAIIINIKNAVDRGESSIVVSAGFMTATTIQKLENLGYGVSREPEFHSEYGDSDPRTPWRRRVNTALYYKYIVSW